MRYFLLTVVLTTLRSTWATPVSTVARRDSVDSWPAECNFSDTNNFVEINNQGNNWCMRGYYAEGNIGCDEHSEDSSWTPIYYTQATHPYCTCNSIAANSQGRRPLSVAIYYKGLHNPQWMDVNTSDVPTDDGRCYSYLRTDGSVQANAAFPHWSTGGVQSFCLWLNHTNVPEQIAGFSTKKYVGNPDCPYL